MALDAFVARERHMTEATNAIHALAGHNAILDRLAVFAANDLVWAGILALVWLYLSHATTRPFVAAAMGAVLAVVISAVFGQLDYVPRPFAAEHFTPLIGHAADSSFPSDHLAALGAVSSVSWVVARRLSLVLLVVSGLVALARVFVGVHWVSDVVAGFLLGAVCGLVLWYASRPSIGLLARLDKWIRPWRRHAAS